MFPLTSKNLREEWSKAKEFGEELNQCFSRTVQENYCLFYYKWFLLQKSGLGVLGGSLSIHPPLFCFLVKTIVVTRTSIRILSVNDRNPSSNGFKLKREFTGICKQKWCLANRANVPKTWTFFVFWFNFPLKWGHPPTASFNAATPQKFQAHLLFNLEREPLPGSSITCPRIKCHRLMTESCVYPGAAHGGHEDAVFWLVRQESHDPSWGWLQFGRGSQKENQHAVAKTRGNSDVSWHLFTVEREVEGSVTEMTY